MERSFDVCSDFAFLSLILFSFIWNLAFIDNNLHKVTHQHPSKFTMVFSPSLQWTSLVLPPLQPWFSPYPWLLPLRATRFLCSQSLSLFYPFSSWAHLFTPYFVLFCFTLASVHFTLLFSCQSWAFDWHFHVIHASNSICPNQTSPLFQNLLHTSPSSVTNIPSVIAQPLCALVSVVQCSHYLPNMALDLSSYK